MQTKRQLRRRISELEQQCAMERRKAIAARGDEGLANREAATWRRRAIESADRLVAAQYEVRHLRRITAAYDRHVLRELLGRPALKGVAKVLEVSS